MDIKVSQCFIAVDDHDKALGFYRDILGLEVRNDVGFEGMRWVTVAAPSQDVEIVLEPPVGDPNASDTDKEAAAELLAKGLLRAVIFKTDDCDRTFDRSVPPGPPHEVELTLERGLRCVDSDDEQAVVSGGLRPRTDGRFLAHQMMHVSVQ